MRIVILSLDHIYANKVAKDLIGQYHENIILIIDSGVIVPQKTILSGFTKYLKVSGLRYVCTQLLKLEIYKILSTITPYVPGIDKKNKFYSFKKLAKNKNIEIIRIKNINSNFFQEILKNEKPDLLVSVLFNQVLKPETIKLAKYGAINIHPAYLPDYKGVSPVFWALANGEKYSGVSIHQIDNKIDTGKIIARSKVKIEKGETEDSLYWKCVKAGSPLLVTAIDSIFNKTVKYSTNSGGRYFSIPTRLAVNNLTKRKSGFFDLVQYLFKN